MEVPVTIQAASVATTEACQDLDLAYQLCEQMTRRSGSNFYCAFWSLPREMFRQMCVVYAFMHTVDDVGDIGQGTSQDRKAKLDQWRADLNLAFETGGSDQPIVNALVDVARKKEIDQQLFQTVIDGVESDLVPRRFESFEDLEKYCDQVAGAVGLCCLKIWGCQPENAEQLASYCGTAFQLTNIIRDLREDAERGRIYLPCEDLRRFKVTDETILTCRLTDAFRELLEFEVRRAWQFYCKATPLLELVSPQGRKILSGFFASYSSLLHEIERRDYDVFSKRISLSRLKKSSIAIKSLLGLPIRFTLAESTRPAN